MHWQSTQLRETSPSWHDASILTDVTSKVSRLNAVMRPVQPSVAPALTLMLSVRMDAAQGAAYRVVPA